MSGRTAPPGPLVRALGLAVALGIAFWLGEVQPGRAAEPADLRTPADVDARMTQVLAERGIDGAAVIIRRGDGHGGYREVMNRYYGAYTPATVVPIASATKWYTAAAVAAAVDAGKLKFDDPVGKYIPGLPPEKAAIPLRFTLAHISGLPAFSPTVEPTRKDLDEAARKVLEAPAKGKPGEVFVYSGTAMQVAARSTEIAEGRTWREIFRTRIAAPLGLTSTRYGDDDRLTPITGGGIVSNAEDMARFAEMMAGRGRFRGSQVLADATVRDMTRLISQGARPVSVPRMAERFAGMGTGVWCESADAAGDCRVIGSLGAFAAYAFVDYDHDLYGVLFVKTDPKNILDTWWAIQRAAALIN